MQDRGRGQVQASGDSGRRPAVGAGRMMRARRACGAIRNRRGPARSGPVVRRPSGRPASGGVLCTYAPPAETRRHRPRKCFISSLTGTLAATVSWRGFCRRGQVVHSKQLTATTRVRPAPRDAARPPAQSDAAVRSSVIVTLPQVVNPQAATPRTPPAFSAVIDFVGSEQSAALGLGVLAAGGLLVVVGLFGGELRAPQPTGRCAASPCRARTSAASPRCAS